jgi:mono/diheme cytochrome c family protein|tara:strand:+ start:3455 stop:3766 length:312 start_codon:yes stop_codon:yes gene_type:complete
MSKKILLLAIFFTLKFNFVQSDEKFELGKDIFLNVGNCGACHSLKDAGAVANVGPNLNEIKPDIGRVINAVTNGIGVMPSFLGILSEEEINAVAYYVSESSID